MLLKVGIYEGILAVRNLIVLQACC